MTKDDLVRMAGEAGFVIDEKAQQHQPNCVFHTYHMVDELLERFAALVAEREREGCAKLCDALAKATHPNEEQVGPGSCAAAIRARGHS
jgi:uncharacterized protein YfcZ (UPF0381/DUF406 family)